MRAFFAPLGLNREAKGLWWRRADDRCLNRGYTPENRIEHFGLRSFQTKLVRFAKAANQSGCRTLYERSLFRKPLASAGGFSCVVRSISLAFQSAVSDGSSCMHNATMSPERATQINNLAMEQAMVSFENETDLTADDAAYINRGSLRNETERRRFKHDYRRHLRNIAEANPFYH